MRRRHFLLAVGIGILWTRRGRADATLRAPCEGAAKTGTPAKGDVERGWLDAAAVRARGAGRPLLVVVIPEDEGEMNARGEALGELLRYGTDEQLGPLAAVDVVCATAAELRARTAIAGEPMFVLLDGPNVRALPARFTRRTWDGRGFDDEKQERDGQDALSDKRIAELAADLRALIGAGDPKRAHAIVAALRKKAPAGSHWADASSCGFSHVDDLPEDDSISVGCGMGRVPAKSERFLYFFSKSPSAREVARMNAEREHEKPEKKTK